jgi:hypothetical protein
MLALCCLQYIRRTIIWTGPQVLAGTCSHDAWEDTLPRPDRRFPFWLLATSDSTRAITLLDQLLSRSPELKALNLGNLLDYEHPVSGAAWKYIIDPWEHTVRT